MRVKTQPVFTQPVLRSFMHLLSDAVEQLRGEMDKASFPIAYMLCSLGFLLVYFAEILVHAALDKQQISAEHAKNSAYRANEAENTQLGQVAVDFSPTSPNTQHGHAHSHDKNAHHGHGHSHGNGKHGHGHGGEVLAATSGASIISAILFFLAIMLHSFLEGLGFGVTSGFSVGTLVS